LAATKADLLDRGLIILLDRLTEQQQKNISEIWTRFYEIRPKLLGYIFDILVKVLNMNIDNPVKLGKLPRMAEFAISGETTSRCMGNPDNAFTEAFKNNRRLQATQILETSPVAMVLNEFMEGTIEETEKGYDTVDIRNHVKRLANNRYEWRGPATELLTQLTIKALQISVSVKSKLWPGAPHILSRRLTEIRATLKEIGIEIEFERDVGRYKKREIIVTKIPSPASPASPDENHTQKDGNNGDATKTGYSTSVSNKQVASLKIIENRAQNSDGDGRDARDTTLSTIIPPDYGKPTIDYEEYVKQQTERNSKVLEDEQGLTFQPYVHRVSLHSDRWKCDFCNYRDDKWGMAKHSHTPEEMKKGPHRRND
jgi:hypothetical protein